MPDVSVQTPGWLREARALAEQAALPETVAVLDELAAGRGRPTFRIVVVGEFNRGKSTLLNTLLGRELLPTGPLPVTRTPVAVRAGAEDVLSVEWPDGSREERRPDAPDAWRGLILHPDAPAARAAASEPAAAGSPALTLTVAGDWLRSLNAELLDTPGVNSVAEEQFEQVRQAVASSDAALFVVSALSPLGATERRLLEEEVLCRHVVHAAVVVTMLDLLDPDDREPALLDIQQRLADLSAIRVLPAPAPCAAEPAAQGSAVSAAVAEFAAAGGRALWRDRRIAAQVADQCAALSAFAARALAAGRGEDAEAEREAARQAAAETGRRWEQLRIDLTSRRLALGAAVREEIHKRREDLVERLRWELERAQDPQLWWGRDLPVRLRRELALMAGACERTVALPALTEDTRWLDQAIAALLPDVPRGPAPSGLRLTAEPLLSGEVSDLSRTRLFNRLGAQGGAILGYLVAAARSAAMPMIYGAGFSIVGGLIAEASIRSATEEQRREVDAVLVKVVGESTAAFQRQTAQVVADVHGELFERLDRSRRAWQRAADPDTAAAQRPGADWADLARTATGLATRIRTALRG
ncbi:dynamin family protein [Streptomyces sp. NBC_01198]|uniref:dynamin family protein n=1 Tax=Streptomyces sp. NBC_01198 TaxID=2903769 RepID=UPI002E0D74B2|nr:dynamin family protein [Streptomyces sp. NBC_01198]